MKIDLPTFATQKKLHKFLVENKASLIAQRKAATKYADAFGGVDCSLVGMKAETLKANSPIINYAELDSIFVKAVINTTNILDSHRDVHLKGIWNRTVKNNRFPLHVQEHKANEFEKIIADGPDLVQSVKTFTWKELGFNYEGKCEALLFESVVKRERNKYMFEQYAKGRVKNHSVGMRYVKIDLCVNDEEWPEEYGNWKEFISEIANKEDLEGVSYFWAVHEAKAIEGSAVPLGSNFATPTIENNAKTHESTHGNKNDSPNGTHEFYKHLIF